MEFPQKKLLHIENQHKLGENSVLPGNLDISFPCHMRIR
jgi:hypothetical protein